MRRQPPNFRTYVKQVHKNYQKGHLTSQAITEWFESQGIRATVKDIPLILRSQVESRIFHRLGQAAKKKGLFVWVRDIVSVPSLKEWGGVHQTWRADFHTIKFFKKVERVVIEKDWSRVE